MITPVRTGADTRIVWSPKHGGCLMNQRYRGGQWCDWSSQGEREYPTAESASRALDDLDRVYAARAAQVGGR